MKRLILRHGDQEIEMPRGESYVGRSIDCHLRFNDSAISRRHLRVMCHDQGVFIENLSMTNGTRVNGHRLLETSRVENGDEIELGHRVLKVELQDLVEAERVQIFDAKEVGPGLLIGEAFGDEDASESTRPGLVVSAGVLASMAIPAERNCPKCLARVASEEDTCPTCLYRWPPNMPSSVTQQIEIANVPRTDRRHIIQVPLIYSSEDLVLDAVARDVSRGGMFIASEILEPVGTNCELTLLPDGRGALQFSARICHVSTEPLGDRPPGFGVSFVSVSPEAQRWLDDVTTRRA